MDLKVAIVETREGTFRVWWAGLDRLARTRTPFLRYRDALRFSQQIECQLLIELMIADQEQPDEESAVH
jgi:hypothetical protein